MLRNLPENLLIPGSAQSIETELDQPIFSWKMGLRPVRARIEGLTTLGNAIQRELHAQLQNQAPEWLDQGSQVCSLSVEVDRLNVCASNARMLVESSRNNSLSLVFDILLRERRRTRLKVTFRICEELCLLSEAVSRLSKATVVYEFNQMRSVFERLPASLAVVESTQAHLSAVICGYRSEIMATLAALSVKQSSGSFEHELSGHVRSECGADQDSFVSNESIFWYRSSPQDEDLMVASYIDAILRTNIFTQLMAGETWERVLSSECQCRSSAALATMSQRLGVVSTHIPVIHEDLIERMQTELAEMYAVLVLVTFGGSAFCALVSEGIESDLVHAHDCWLTRLRLPRLRAAIDSDRMMKRIDAINRMRPRSGRVPSIAQLAIATESLRTLGGLLYDDLAEVVYVPFITSAFAHAIDGWRNQLYEFGIENYMLANQSFVTETKSFFSMLKSTGGACIPQSAINTIAALAGRIIVHAILESLPVLIFRDDEEMELQERSQLLTEAVSELQSRLIRTTPILLDQTEWSLVFESLQLIPHSELLLTWAVSNLLRVPLRILLGLVEASEPDEETRIDLIEILENQAVAFITSS